MGKQRLQSSGDLSTPGGGGLHQGTQSQLGAGAQGPAPLESHQGCRQ